MNRTQFRQLVDSQVLVLDGATGSNLMDAGMPLGVCPEKWILEHPDKLIALQSRLEYSICAYIYMQQDKACGVSS